MHREMEKWLCLIFISALFGCHDTALLDMQSEQPWVGPHQMARLQGVQKYRGTALWLQLRWLEPVDGKVVADAADVIKRSTEHLQRVMPAHSWNPEWYKTGYFPPDGKIPVWTIVSLRPLVLIGPAYFTRGDGFIDPPMKDLDVPSQFRPVSLNLDTDTSINVTFQLVPPFGTVEPIRVRFWLPYYLRYGTRIPHQNILLWTSPDYADGAHALELSSKDTAIIPVVWGRLRLSRKESEWIVTTEKE